MRVNSCTCAEKTLSNPLVPRRHFLWQAGGLGGLALTWLLHQDAQGSELRSPASPYSAKPTHFPPRAKRVIQVFCPGGVSHLDTFDFKPELVKHDGRAMAGKGKVDTFFGQPGNLMKSPFAFRRHGRCGRWVSSLFPQLAACVDDLTFVH